MAAAEGFSGGSLLVVGAGGQLGGAVLEVLADRSIPAEACDLAEGEGPECRIVRLDITDKEACRVFLERTRPSAVVNCAAYTAVDRAEDEEDKADLVNRVGAANVAAAAAGVGAGMIHFSTDFVFDGTKGSPYNEEDPPAPLSAYGRTKLAGEEAVRKAAPDHLILRTAWLFGPHGPNFVKTILRAARERDELNVVDDQTGSPACALDLAACLPLLLEKNLRGTFHLVNQGQTTWYGLAGEALRLTGSRVRINPISSDRYPAKAVRPAYSVLSCAKLAGHGIRMRTWEEALAACLEHKDWSL